MKRMNSNDIARLAGVSRSTVSRVINGYANVPEKTREKVMKVIKENHYYPLLSGQMLSGKKSQTIGLFWLTSSPIAADPLCSSYFMHVIDAARERGYLVLSCIIDNLTEKKNINYVRKIFMEGRIDAGIFIGINNNEPLVDELVGLGKIVGLFDYYHENEEIANCLSVNFERNSGEKAIDYLYELGHRKIAVIDGDLRRLCSMHRHEGYLRGLMKYSLQIQNKWLTYGGIVEESGYESALRMLSDCMDDLPTAICANNDGVAFGVYRACKELGLRIPEDISVIGVDGHSNGAYIQPPLTTISFDFQKMFSSLIYRVIDTIDQLESPMLTEFIDGEITARGSCRSIEVQD